MDIGSLTGAIAIEDQLTGKLSMMTAKVQQFAENFNGVMGAAAIGAGAITAAVLGAAVSIQKLGEQGSVILGVEASFDRLARTAGSTGDELLGGLNRGVRDTIDSMVLMQATNKLLASGMQLTGKNMETMGSLAREMGKATGEDASNGVRVLSTSLLTGNTMLLKRFGVQVDLKRAEEDFAKSLGVTRKELSSEGVLQARRIGMLTAMQTKLDTLGVSELSFKEKIMQGQIAIGNWVDNLSKAIAASPAVNKALDSIKKAFSDIVGSRSQAALEWIMGWVNRFSEGVATAMPIITEVFEKVKTKITELWNWLVDFNERWQITSTLISIAEKAWGLLQKAFELVELAIKKVMQAWDAMPEWLKKLTRGSLEAALAMSAYTIAIGAVATPISELFGQLDLGINIIGNLSGAVFNIVSLHGPWHTMTTAVAAKYALLTTSIASNTIVVWAHSVSATAVANATVVWSMVASGLAGWMSTLTSRIVATTIAQNISAISARVLAAVQATMRGIVLALSMDYMVLTTRIGASTFMMNAYRLSAVAAATASVALGTALQFVKFVLLPLAAAWAAWEFGKWLGSFASVQRSVIWLAEKLHIISNETARARREFLGLDEAVQNFGDNTGYVKVTPEMLEYQNQVTKIGKEAGKTGVELDNFVNEAIRKAHELKDNGGQAVSLMAEQLRLLSKAGDTAGLKKLAEEAANLSANGAKLTPELDALVKKMGEEPGGGGKKSWLRVGGEDADEFGKRVKDLTKSLTTVAEPIRVFEATFKGLSSAQRADYEIQQGLVAEMDKMLSAGQALTPEMSLLYETHLRNARAVRENSIAMLTAQGVTIGAVEAQREQGESLVHIADGYGVTVESLNAYLETLKQAAEDEKTFSEQQRSDFGKTSSIRMAAYSSMMAAEREYSDMRTTADGDSVEAQVARVERELTLELDKLNDLKGMYSEYTDYYEREESARRAIATHTVSVITGNQTTIVERMRSAGVETRADLNKTALNAIRDYSQMKASGEFSAAQIKAAFERAQEAMRAAAGKTSKDWRDIASEVADAFGTMFEGINSKVGQAIHIFAGGLKTMVDKSKDAATRISAAFATVGSMLASIFGEGAATSKIQSGILGAAGGAAAGVATGAMVGSLFGPGGTAVGATIGGIIGGITGALGGWLSAARRLREENQKATATIQGYQTELLKTYGSLTNIDTIGKMLGVDLAGAWGDQSQAGLVHFKSLMESFNGQMEQLQSALDTYGLTWRDLNLEMRQMNITTVANKLISDFNLMTKAGVDTDLAIRQMGPSLSQLVIESINTGTKIPAALQPIIVKLIEMGGLTDEAARAMLGLQQDTMPSLADVTAAAERYGLKLDDLGPKVQQLRINEQAKQIVDDFAILTAAGVPFDVLMKDTSKHVTDTGANFDSMSAQAQKAYLDAGGVVTTVTTGMHSDIQDMVTKSLAAGVELPQAMKPIIQQLIEAGGENGLVDQFGNALTDVSQLNFAADLSGMFETLIDKLNDLVDAITGVGNATDGITGNEIVIPYRYEQRGDNPGDYAPGYSGGGVVYAANGFVPRGTDTVPAMLTPGERVLSIAENRAYERGGGQEMVMAPIIMEGIKVAEALVRTKERYGLGRGRR